MPNYKVQYYEKIPSDLKTIEVTEETAAKAKEVAMDKLDNQLDVGHYMIHKVVETKS
ncbi:hypothetical protein RRU94_16170 [Domibacillus sp. DTU_2020_1001157_1_SI_ALB_TIR_016]|uniref:hypothetical protein n=1 Tax=Domibacillus sp. DTU_2020_1001157_1_SI_ALB_TIR_016 TaxID=3077789 RepID=UPI0028E9B31A|nr:hypothetical protein [Domibacillus sp. DTU_2020_1001157_1_SI_ALB_TIR_016]WNS82272.1 hypothetical protein RRU94_16170 [Domibacillus sp. DTU_2020_1001157_1_SI_ALB_TIR_016]